MSAGTGFRFTGRSVFALFAAFFGVIIIVNGIFVWKATTTWRGLDTADAYVKGLAYNEVLERAAAQKALGWQVAVSVDGDRPVLRLADSTGAPLGGLSVTALARRPVDEHDDRALLMVHQGDGVYRADQSLAARGQWDLHIEIARRAAPAYIVEQRIWLPEQGDG